jgi:hypothetical protein
MSKILSLTLSDEVYKQLSSLGDLYKQDVNQTVDQILKAVGSQQSRIADIGTWTGAPDLEGALHETVWTCIHLYGVAYGVLNRLQVNGQFSLDDFCSNLDDNYFMFLFSARSDSLYDIYSFDVTKEDEQISLTTNTVLPLKEITPQMLEKLNQVIEARDFETPQGFESVDEVEFEVEESDKENSTLTLSIWTESLEDLPTIKQVSQLVKRIFRKAGIKRGGVG